METCGMQIAKYLLFGFNLIFSLSGLIILITGAVVLVGIDEYHTFVESRVIGPPIVLIVAGLIIFVIAFLGCWGALREHRNMLIAYAVLLLIIFVIEFAVGITAAVTKEDFAITMESEMKKSMGQYKSEKIHRTAWDTLQQKLECCGVLRNEEWEQTFNDGIIIPSSCCTDMEKCNNKTRIDGMVFDDGCFFKLQDKVKSATLALAGVGIGIAFIELAGIVLALLLVHTIRLSAQK